MSHFTTWLKRHKIGAMLMSLLLSCDMFLGSYAVSAPQAMAATGPSFTVDTSCVNYGTYGIMKVQPVLKGAYDQETTLVVQQYVGGNALDPVTYKLAAGEEKRLTAVEWFADGELGGEGLRFVATVKSGGQSTPLPEVKVFPLNCRPIGLFFTYDACSQADTVHVFMSEDDAPDVKLTWNDPNGYQKRLDIVAAEDWVISPRPGSITVTVQYQLDNTVTYQMPDCPATVVKVGGTSKATTSTAPRTVTVSNFSPDDESYIVRVEKTGGLAKEYLTGKILSGKSKTITVQLQPGDYTAWATTTYDEKRSEDAPFTVGKYADPKVVKWTSKKYAHVQISVSYPYQDIYSRRLSKSGKWSSWSKERNDAKAGKPIINMANSYSGRTTKYQIKVVPERPRASKAFYLSFSVKR